MRLSQPEGNLDGSRASRATDARTSGASRLLAGEHGSRTRSSCAHGSVFHKPEDLGDGEEAEGDPGEGDDGGDDVALAGDGGDLTGRPFVLFQTS